MARLDVCVCVGGGVVSIEFFIMSQPLIRFATCVSRAEILAARHTVSWFSLL